MKDISTPRKESSLALTKKQLGRAKGYVVLDYRGLTVKEISVLRRKLRAANADTMVVKNTLFRMAATETSTIFDDAVLHGPSAVIFAFGEATDPVKVLADFVKDHPKVHIKGGAFENACLSEDQIKTLARIPPRPVLLSQLAGGLQAPMSGVASVLQAPLSQMARLLQALAEKQGAGAAA